MTTFQFNGMSFTVKQGKEGPVYRERQWHPGWSSAKTSIANTSLHARFRALLRSAVKQIKTGVSAYIRQE